MSTTTADGAKTSGHGFDLGKTFKKANHLRHILMDISMLGGVMGMLVASGGTFGFGNLFTSFASMHFETLAGWLDLSDFLEGATMQAKEGVWLTDMEVDHHEMHGGTDTINTLHAQHAAYTIPKIDVQVPIGEHFSHASHPQVIPEVEEIFNNETANLWGVDPEEHNTLMASHSTP